MKGRIQISMKPNERIFINGAVLRVDRKVTIELLNDVTFLLENHVMQPEAANTPLRQLYFIVQMMLMDPTNAETAKDVFKSTHTLLSSHFTAPEIQAGLAKVSALIDVNKTFDALKAIRTLLPIEEELNGKDKSHHNNKNAKREVA
jgi:flagellar biosynthesis repressor protein FlbT